MKELNILKACLFTILFVLLVELTAIWVFIADYFGIKKILDFEHLINGLIEIVFIYFFIKKINKSDVMLIQKTNRTVYLIAVILGVSFVFVQPILNLFYNFLSGDNVYIDFEFDGFNKFQTILSLNYISAVVFIPIAEELFFRGYIQNKLQEKMRPIYAIGIASFLFSVIHLPYYKLIIWSLEGTMQSAFIAFFGGLVAGYIYNKSKSLGPAILFHITWNLIAILI